MGQQDRSGAEAEADSQEAYAFAIGRLRQTGFDSVADRLASGGVSVDCRPICVAILAAVDRVDLRKAAELDEKSAVQWLAIERDQAEVILAALAFDGVEVTG